MNTDMQDEPIADTWAYIKKLWAYKWVWLITVVVVVGAAGAYSLTLSPKIEVTQSAIITIPGVTSEAEASQQAATFTSISNVIQRLGTRPPISDAILAQHPELQNLDALNNTVTVSGSGLMVDIKATGNDQKELSALARDVANSMSAGLPEAFEANPVHLRPTIAPVGEPIVTSTISSGRSTLVVTAGMVGVIIATALAAVLVARRNDSR